MKLNSKCTRIRMFTNTTLHTILDQAFHILDEGHSLLSGLTDHLAVLYRMLSYTQ